MQKGCVSVSQAFPIPLMMRLFCIAALAACAAAQSMSEIDAEISRLTALRAQHVRRQADVNPQVVTENDNVVNYASPAYSIRFLSLCAAPGPSSQPRFAPTSTYKSIHGEQTYPHRTPNPINPSSQP